MALFSGKAIGMDVARPDVARQKRRRRAAYSTGAVAALLLVTVGISRLEPAAPGVDRATLWIDTVKRGPMVRQVRGLGTLVPEDIAGFRRRQRTGGAGRASPGHRCHARERILDLSNPALELELQDAVSEGESRRGRAGQPAGPAQNEFLQQEAAAGYRRRLPRPMQVGTSNSRTRRWWRPSAAIEARRAAVATPVALAKQLHSHIDSHPGRIAVQQSTSIRPGRSLELRQRQVDELQVRAGRRRRAAGGAGRSRPAGRAGREPRRVADPTRLQAELKIAETQAKDIQVGQVPSIDTRNGIVTGRVVRIDPSVQNGTSPWTSRSTARCRRARGPT